MSATAEQWWNQGVAASARRDHAGAIRAFEQAVRLAPGDPTPATRLALERQVHGDIVGARNGARAVLHLPGLDARTLNLLGHILSQTADFEEAVALFRRAAAMEPDDVAILNNLAWGEQHVGAFGAAEAALRRVLDLAPGDHKAWFSLSGLPSWRPSAGDVANLSRLLESAGGDEEQALRLGHALARAQEALGEPAAALATLEHAKAPRRRNRRFDIEAALAAFEAAPVAWANGPTGPGNPSTAPIFIVGPPRSGTTLLDRILSSHSAVTSAGELRAMPLIAQWVARIQGDQPPSVEIMRRAGGASAELIGRTYLDAAGSMAGTTPRFTDKQPFNLIFAGLIARALPNARILRMRRSPADTVLGNYRQLFNAGSVFHDYAYDLQHTARYVAGLEALSRAWEQRLPADRYRVVDYEALVADPEGQIRAVLDFCGLPWEPACLDFHRNAAGVSTASAVQVREPLHDRNIGLWRRYGSGFEPALEILREAGLEP